MANLTETPVYDTGVYQIETSDPVLGGPTGVTNVPLKNLANRTAYLKSHVDNLESGATVPPGIATQAYLQAELNKLSWKRPARAATTANIALSGTQTIDGVSVQVGDRVLVKDQATGAQNGIYVAAAGAWSRATDCDENAEVVANIVVDVSEGSANGDTSWRMTTNAPITVGSTALAWARLNTDLTGYAPLANPTFTGTPAAPTAAADTTTTQLATTAFVVGQAASVNPVMNGVAAVGTSKKYARQDHVHPSDTSRAPTDSPAFTGTPTAPTPAASDSSTKLATTAHVKSVLGNLGGNVAYDTTGPIAATDAGKLLTLIGMSAYTLTLPEGSTVSPGSVFVFKVLGSGTVKLNRAGSDVISIGADYLLTTLDLKTNETLTLVNSGVQWQAVAGDVLMQHATLFAASKGASGYQKLPSGLILQWGLSSNTGTNTSVTFPIAFPNAAVHISYGSYTSSIGTPSNHYQPSHGSLTTIGFTWGSLTSAGVVNTTAGTAQIAWLAIGY